MAHTPKRLAAAATAAIATVIAWGAAGPAAAAATPQPVSACNASIVDATSAHVLRSDTTTAVAVAAEKLQIKGADIRIRVFDTAPDGSLDAYEAAQVAACPSWSFQGGIKPNLLVFLVSRDHQDAIFYGANYSRIQHQVDQIRADMGSDLRAGNFGAGIAKGEQETYSALYPSGIPRWLIALLILGALGLFAILVAAGGGSRRSSGYGGGYTYIDTGGGWGGGASSGGGSAGGSSGSW
jgi:hypothetical protein